MERKTGRKKAGDSIDWIEIERYYIENDINLDKLADKYNVSYNSVRQMSSRGEWREKKKNFQMELKRKVHILVTDQIAENEAQINTRHYQVWGKLIDIVEDILDNAQKQLVYNKDQISVQKLFQIASVITQSQAGQRLASGLIEEAEKIKLEQMDRRIKIEETKVNPADVMPSTTNFTEALNGESEKIWGEDDK